MGKKRSRRPVVEDEEEKMALEEEEELELELRAAREIMREKMEAGEVPEGFRHLAQMGDDSDDEDGAKGLAPGPPVNNQKGLEQALKDITAKNGPRPWPETLDVCKFELEPFESHDDIKREMAFYSNALSAVKEARELLAKHKVPYKRPEDFFCDMLKSDEHMARVKDRLIFEQKKIAAVEERRKQQENRKFSKAVKSQKAEEKVQEKKRTLEAVKQWKKTKAQRKGQGLLPDDDGLDEVLDGKGQAGSPGGKKGGKGGINKKRLAKDKKYGFGGPKRTMKQNDRKSLNDFSDFNPKRGKSFGKKNKGPNRPGKTARLKKRLNKGKSGK